MNSREASQDPPIGQPRGRRSDESGEDDDIDEQEHSGDKCLCNNQDNKYSSHFFWQHHELSMEQRISVRRGLPSMQAFEVPILTI